MTVLFLRYTYNIRANIKDFATVTVPAYPHITIKTNTIDLVPYAELKINYFRNNVYFCLSYGRFCQAFVRLSTTLQHNQMRTNEASNKWVSAKESTFYDKNDAACTTRILSSILRIPMLTRIDTFKREVITMTEYTTKVEK